MKARISLLLLPLLATLTLGTLAPAQAADTDAVTGLQVSVNQTPGAHDSWNVSATWDANAEVATYTMLITDCATTAATTYGTKDTTSPSATIETTNLVAQETYCVVVRAKGVADAVATSASFQTPVLDTTAPSGAYALDRTSAYLLDDFMSLNASSARFQIIEKAIDPGVTRKVVANAGAAARAWPNGTTFRLSYTQPGTYTPQVILTDGFANSTTITLPAIHVKRDTIAPKVKINKPAHPAKAASWRVLRGTASDVGTGIAIVTSFVVEKRGSTWWAYDFGKRKWLKGYTSMKKTLHRSKARPALARVARTGSWRLPLVKGLTKGTLHVETVAFDNAFNMGTAKPLTQRVH